MTKKEITKEQKIIIDYFKKDYSSSFSESSTLKNGVLKCESFGDSKHLGCLYCDFPTDNSAIHVDLKYSTDQKTNQKCGAYLYIDVYEIYLDNYTHKDRIGKKSLVSLQVKDQDEIDKIINRLNDGDYELIYDYVSANTAKKGDTSSIPEFLFEKKDCFLNKF